MQKWLRENFGYGKREINGSMVLVVLIFAGFLAARLYDKHRYSLAKPDLQGDLKWLEKWAEEQKWTSAAPKKNSRVPESPVALKVENFDPNSVSADELRRFGLPEKIVNNWRNYLQKGGRFRGTEDVRKIYGMSPLLYSALLPHMIFSEQKPRIVQATQFADKQELIPTGKIDINAASADDLMQVQGIGPSFSRRIVKYRKALGGFHSKWQLLSVYGLEAGVAEKIWGRFELDSTQCCRRLNVNMLPADSLEKHPYLSYSQAKAIIAYREQHGRLNGWSDLRLIKILPDSIFLKMKPYFEF